MNSPIVWHSGLINREDRNSLNNHQSGLIWLTGLSAAGKSTIAHRVEKTLFESGVRAYVLDGDNVRHGLCADLGFDREGRKENLRRIAEVAKLFIDGGVIVLCAFISPFKEDREVVKGRFTGKDYFEVYIKCSIEECEKRDPKGLYKKARQGIIKNYTGISSPYEEPENPDLIVDTEALNVDESVQRILEFIQKQFFLGERRLQLSPP